MSETIDRMLADARAKTKEPPLEWWQRITEDDLPAIYREALARAVGGAGVRMSDDEADLPTTKVLLDHLAQLYTWKSFFVAHLHQTKRDPQQTIVRDLREMLGHHA